MISGPVYFSWLESVLEIRSEASFCESLLDSIRFDFALLEAEKKDAFAVISVFDLTRMPAHGEMPLFRFRGARVTTDWRSRWICYPDKTVVRLRKKEKLEVEIFAPDVAKAHHHLYLLMHALLGESLERNGFTRVHAMSFTAGTKALVLMAPSGVGKSTLALQILQQRENAIFSDEITLLKAGQVYGLPCRLALDLPPELDLSFQSSRRFRHKSLLPIPANRVAKSQPLHRLYYTHRTKLGEVSLRPLGLREIVSFLVQFTIGYHLPQITEVCLRRDSLWFVLKMFWRRMQLAVRLLAQGQVQKLFLANHGGPEELLQVLENAASDGRLTSFEGNAIFRS